MASRLDTLDQSFNWRSKKVEWPVTTITSQGLSGVIACETKVAWVNPNTGDFSYRGIPIQELAGKATFEEVAYLLVEGKPWKEHPEKYKSFCQKLHSVRQMPVEVLQILASQPVTTHPTRLLRALISALGCYEMQNKDTRDGHHIWGDVWIISQVVALVGHIARFRKGLKPMITDYRQSLARDMLYMILNKKPSLEQEKLLNLLWVLYADHGLDAPTFTGLVVGCTKADPYYNIVAGLSALRGPLVGGAVEGVIQMLVGLRDANVARAWTEGMITKGFRIPGFGRRIHSQPDPRVDILRGILPEYAKTTEQQLLLEVSTTIEDTASAYLNPKGVYVNLNYYSALLFHYLSVEPEMVTCFYAIGRMAGLVARVREYLTTNRLFRPRERYIGKRDQSYTIIGKR
ncbi:MAG: citrate/2-methylcitrate synthase [Calditrichaeota bacterium]|jgi:citrate synthase|nr:citrate/2-methylcitrate synthase [Calditrichota bacterium]MBT7617358.1 citrate/2-methylcitrate synthase [Calditrichota bacterium]MBT7790066.1 citrate/2-methylcitrate synthase [Calditrichota bacterium]